MVEITELEKEHPELFEESASGDDAPPPTPSENMMAAAMKNPAVGWVAMGKNWREMGNAAFAMGDWERSAKAYRMGADNINNLRYKNVSDEDDEPFVVKKTEEEIAKEGLYSDELKDLHLVMLKNLSLAHINMNEMANAILAADSALEIDPADPKALYRKAHALQKRGNEKDLEGVKELLKTMEELKLAEGSREAGEVKLGVAKIRKMAALDRKKARMLQKNLVSALESEPGTFSNRGGEEKKKSKNYSPKLTPEERYKQNGEILSTEQAFDIVEKLADGYQSDEIQNKIQEALKKRSNDPNDSEFRLRLADIAMVVQRPILEEYGFQPNKKGLTEMLAALYAHEHDENDEGNELKPLMGIAFGSLMSAAWGAKQ